MSFEKRIFEPIEEPSRLLGAGSRPASVWFRGGTVRVDVHDAWYLAECRKFIAAARRLHPDYVRVGKRDGGVRTGSGFKLVMESFRAFQKREREFYTALGLKPPLVHFRGLPRLLRRYHRPARTNYPFPEPEQARGASASA